MSDEKEPKEGDHVCMTYRGRELLGTVRAVIVPKDPKQYTYINVVHFNGEPWPLEPMSWEVRVLERTFEKEPEE